MTLDELRAILADSPRTNWHVLTGFPTYRDNVNAIVDGLENLESHHHTAVYEPDVDLTIAWGMPVPGDENPHPAGSLGATLGHSFPDTSISSFQVDVFYSGSLVDRHHGMWVDGYRAALPYPDFKPPAETDPENPFAGEWSATSWAVDFFRLIDGLTGHGQYDSYLERSPIVVQG